MLRGNGGGSPLNELRLVSSVVTVTFPRRVVLTLVRK